MCTVWEPKGIFILLNNHSFKPVMQGFFLVGGELLNYNINLYFINIDRNLTQD